VATSSGKIGHSLSFGERMVTIVAESSAVAMLGQLVLVISFIQKDVEKA
jgi:hypothetical protein